MKFPSSLSWRALAAALCAVWLAGCDVSPDYHLGGGPINSGGDPLNPDNPANITAYFYVDRPVEGLIFSCAVPGALPVTGTTDENGAFVCPRASTVSFFLGTVEAGTLKLGEVELQIFGLETDTNNRNHVAITPLTLYGTTTNTLWGTGAANDNTDYEVPNIFNLLNALDVPHLMRQPTIRITTEVATLIGPSLVSLDLNQPPLSFIDSIGPAIAGIDPDNPAPNNPAGSVNLMLDGNMLSPSELATLTDAALRRARSGLYRASPQFTKAEGNRAMIGNISFLLGNDGQIAGFGETRVITKTSTDTSTVLEVFYLDPTAEVEADGDLINMSAEDGVAGTTRDIDFIGRLINDRVFGSLLFITDDSEVLVPTYYRESQVPSSTHVGDFITTDGFDSTVDSTGESGLWLVRLTDTLPDIDLDLLPLGYEFPRSYMLKFKGYPDGATATAAQRENPAYLVSLPDRENVNDYVGLEPDGFIQIQILPNGDIVSDLDGDCSPVVPSGNEFRDEDGAGQVELLVGKVGNIFEDMGPPVGAGTEDRMHSYVSLLLTVYDRRHPQAGFTLGFQTLSSQPDPVVLDATADHEGDANDPLLLNKRCKPLETCDRPIEWFNDIRFFTDFLAPAFAPGLDSAAISALYKQPDYYGQVTEFTRVCTGP